jgi:NADH-quinone oxidoreductase subunit L
MRRMGGLWRYLPITYAVMIIGNIAITGIGIPELFGFAGFYSKDTIIEAAYAAGAQNGVALFAFIVGVIVAGLTAFYSWRLAFMTFHGTAKWGHDAHEAHHADDHASHAQHETHDEPLEGDHHHDHKPHESPLVMILPLLVLSVGAIFAGYLFYDQFVGHHENEFWRGAIFSGPHNHVLHDAHSVPQWVKFSPLVVSLLGLAGAFFVYVMREGMGARIAANAGPAWTFFYNKWFFDEVYDAIFVRGARFLGDLFWKGGDQKIIDGLGPDGVSAVSAMVGARTGRLQTGYLYHYAFVMLLGVAGLLTYALYAWSGG